MFLLILGVIALVVGVIAFLIGLSDNDTPFKVGGVAAVIVAVVLIIASCIASVPTGHTGIVSNFGKIADYNYDAGVHFKAPWTKIIKMDNRTQKGTIETACFSSDIQQVTVKYTLNYCIDKKNAQDIYKTIGRDYYETVVTPSIQETLKTVIAKYTAEELVSSRAEMAQNAEKSLTETLKEYNIKVVGTAIENMDFTDAFEQAVEDKQVAQQNKLKAEAEAQKKIVEAEGEAKSKVIKANGEAEANAIISNSLTDDILYQKWLDEWDGKLPQVAGSDANVIIGSLTK